MFPLSLLQHTFHLSELPLVLHLHQKHVLLLSLQLQPVSVPFPIHRVAGCTTPRGTLVLAAMVPVLSMALGSAPLLSTMTAALPMPGPVLVVVVAGLTIIIGLAGLAVVPVTAVTRLCVLYWMTVVPTAPLPYPLTAAISCL